MWNIENISGTTLNLLKFPITRESREQQYARVRRLRQEQAHKKEAKRLALERQFDKAEPDTWQLSGISDFCLQFFSISCFNISFRADN